VEPTRSPAAENFEICLLGLNVSASWTITTFEEVCRMSVDRRARFSAAVAEQDVPSQGEPKKVFVA
jgi:hypothetical protein